MSTIKLHSLYIKNFRGIKEFTLKPEGEDVLVYGPNGAGKTSCADALNWLLFDKDSAGASKFGLKPTVNGEELHNLEHEVSAALIIDGKGVALRKVMTEKWVKTRGTTIPEFKGHETAYYISEVPKSLTEYNAFIASTCPESLFRMLSNVTYFNEHMPWQERRSAIIGLADEVTPEQVYEAHPELAELTKCLPEGRTVEDHRKTMDLQRKKLADALKTIPARIDEAKRGKPAENAAIPPQGESYGDLNHKLIKLQNERAAVLAGDTSDTKAKIAAKRKEIEDVSGAYRMAKYDAEEEVARFRRAARTAEGDIEIVKQKISACEQKIDRANEELKELREKWAVINAEAVPEEPACPTCEQPLPVEKANAAKAKFRKDKADRLEANRKQGIGKKADIQEATEKLQAYKKELERLTNDHQLAEESMAAVVMPQEPDLSTLNAELAELEATIATGTGAKDTTKIDTELEKVKSLIKLHDEAAVAVKRLAEVDARVKELTDEQKKTGKELDETEKQIQLCDGFAKAKVAIIKDSVNAKFSPLRIKLFEPQINGGIADTCVTMMDGKEYEKLSKGEKVIAGVTTIKVLSEHYGINTVVFIDNLESVTIPLPELPGQVIQLKAMSDSSTDAPGTLRVKYNRKEVAA